MNTRPCLVAVAALAALTAGCNQPTPSPAGHTSAPIAAPAKPAPAAAARTAANVLDELSADETLGITRGLVQDALSDPNNLLGRPGQYLSRASFDLPGGDRTADPGLIDRGGVIEVFLDSADAQTRAHYLDVVTKMMPIFAEYDYLAGPILVRVAGSVSPADAARIGTAVRSIGPVPLALAR
jgi:hypothetical protein